MTQQEFNERANAAVIAFTAGTAFGALVILALSIVLDARGI